MKKFTTFFATMFSVAALCATATLADPPSDHKGVSVFGKASLALGDQIPAMKGFEVRVRSVVVEPQGIVKFHSHDTRPGGFYVIRGDGVREYQSADDKVGRIVKAGTSVLEDMGTSHWIKNEGGEAEFFVFDIVPIKK